MRKRLLAVSACVLITLAVFSPVCRSAGEGEETKGTPAGWSDEINLSNDPSTWDQMPNIAVNGDTIHVVWDHRYRDVYYSKSIDCGKSWSSPDVLFSCTTMIDEPYLGISGNIVHVVWSYDDLSGTREILYTNSTDNGDTWDSPREIFNETGFDAICWGIYVNNSNVHIISEDFRDGANGEIYYRRSQDGGITWDNGQGVDDDRRITYGLTVKTGMKINGDNSNISIIWQDERDGDWEVYWMISKDNGFTWEDGLGTPNVGRQLTDDTVDTLDLTIGVNGSNIHIIWADQIWPGPEYHLYYRNSTDNGVTWNPLTYLTGPYSTHPNINVVNQNLSLVWACSRFDGVHEEIYFKNSTNGGITWSGDLRLTFNNTEWSYHPKIMVENKVIHIVWYDRHSGGETEVMYKRYPDFPPDPVCNVSVQEGWNLISFPLDISGHPLDMLDDSPGVGDNLTDWDVVMAYDAVNKIWLTYSKNRPDFLNTLTYLDNKMGFWINITNLGDGFLTFTGLESSDTSVVLYAGWNLVGYPTLNDTETVANGLWGTGADRVMVGDASEPYLIREVGPTYVMKPGEGYWIHVVSDSVWIVDW